MSINWVMLAEAGGYTPLPGEQTLYVSPPRTTLSVQSPSHRCPGQAYSMQCKSGSVYLTNRRIIYLPSTPTPALQSFAVPILNVQDSRVTAPWFGANKWEAVIQPVVGGGIPAQHAFLEMVMEFKEGGAFDFSTTFERLKERLQQAVEVARESGLVTGDGAELGGGAGGGALAGVNMDQVHLEDLPAYEESSTSRAYPSPPPPPPPAAEPYTPPRSISSPQALSFHPPSDPPPDYEEVQRDSIVEELERRLRLDEEQQGRS